MIFLFVLGDFFSLSLFKARFLFLIVLRRMSMFLLMFVCLGDDSFLFCLFKAICFWGGCC